MYDNGEGLSQDLVAAHMWLSLAATQDPDTSGVEARDAVAAEMTSDQIAEAERRAREWKPTGQR